MRGEFERVAGQLIRSGTGADNTVSSIALQSDGKVLIGGAFATINGTARGRIARLTAAGTLDTTFDPGTGANGTLESIAISPDARIYIGGRFWTYNGVSVNRLARVNDNGSLDTSYTTDLNNDARFFVRRLLFQLDGKLLITGMFKEYSGIPHNSLVRLYTPQVLGGTQPISFTTNRNGNNDIYRMNADGTNQQQLTNAPEGESDAKWSPDGTKIVYTKTLTSIDKQVWTMNADGSGKTLVSNAAGYNVALNWSPNGRKILFGTSTSTSNLFLWTMDPDGTNKQQLTSNASQVDHFAQWSPDSSKIAFGRCTAPTFVCDLYVINANGTGVTNLTPSNPDDDDVPYWTPDGTRIVFARGQASNTVINTYVMNADGSNLQPLTNITTPNINLAPFGGISPDGTRGSSGVSRRFGPGSARRPARALFGWDQWHRPGPHHEQFGV